MSARWRCSESLGRHWAPAPMHQRQAQQARIARTHRMIILCWNDERRPRKQKKNKKQSTSHRLIAIGRPFTSHQSTNLIIFHELFDESTHYNSLPTKWHFKLLHLYNLFYGYLYHLYCNVFQLCLHLTFYGNGFNASVRWNFFYIK